MTSRSLFNRGTDFIIKSVPLYFGGEYAKD